MSLRPIDPALGRVARAYDRMAPGGRRWSESPIPRRATRRLPSMGVPVAETFYTKWDSLQTLDPSEYGYLIVVYVHSLVAPTSMAPSGWTLVDSGSAGSAVWWGLLWAFGSATLDCDVESGWGSGTPGVNDVYSRGYLVASPGALRPRIADSNTATAALSIALPTGPAGTLPNQFGSYVPDSSAAITFGWSPADVYSSFANTGLSGSNVIWGMFGTDPRLSGDGSDAGPFPSGSSRTASASGTWVAHYVHLA